MAFQRFKQHPLVSGLLLGGQRVKYGAKALPEGGWNTQPHLFVDGALAITRPVYRNFSFGFGIWGGAQPGLARLDAGPRLTVQVRRNVKVHADWRQKLAGNARPGSGPALTLSGDF